MTPEQMQSALDRMKPFWLNGEYIDPLVEMGIKSPFEDFPGGNDSQGLFQMIPYSFNDFKD